MAAAALVISVLGVVISGAALVIARNNLKAAERSAAAAEASAASAKRSAAAAERNAAAAEKGVDLEVRRESDAQQRQVAAAAPRFEPDSNGSTGTFNLHSVANRFAAHLRNVGGSPATVQRATLEHVGGATEATVLIEAANQEQLQPPVTVDRGQTALLLFESDALSALRTDAGRPQLIVSYTSDAGDARVTFVLGHIAVDAAQRPQWRVLSSELS